VRRLDGALVAAVVVGALLLAAPFYYAPYRVEQIASALVLAIIVLGLGILTGFSGQISLGHSAFVGIGAYIAAILVEDHGWPYVATIPVAGAVCLGAGIVVGLPALRLRGLHLALVTLAFAAVFPAMLRRFNGLTHGNRGIRLDDAVAPGWTGLADDQWVYMVVLVTAAALFLFARNVIRSRVGRSMIAVRDDEIAAQAAGINVARVRTLAFGLSALFAGVAGALETLLVGAVAPSSFGVLPSIGYVVGLVIGGVGSLVGALIGGFAIHFLPRWAADINVQLSGVVYGGLLIALTYIAPDGIVGLGRRARRLLSSPTNQGDNKS